VKRQTLQGERVVIYGAGRGGELLLREILNNSALQLKPLGFIDDDRLKVGKQIQGFPILGTFESLLALKRKHTIAGVLLSFDGAANADAFQRACRFCRQNDLSLKKFSIGLKTVDLEEEA
jgi:UDP-GlcNAc:undecaprenyl-phosphate GlcNAc-1-phosphate transferase